jgi:sporulation protein YlmC with PRC-barrel domain
MKRMTETYDMRVFTDSGEYFGDVEEVSYKLQSIWMEGRATRTHSLQKFLALQKEL